MKQFLKNTNKGFTLVELLVSVAIFAIVMTISLGAILTILDTNRKAQSLKSVMNNLNYALENMTRSIKTSKTFVENGECEYSNDVYTSNGIEVENYDGSKVEYALNSTGQITMEDVPITAEEIKVEYLCFKVIGISSSGDKIQPKINMIVKGSSGVNQKTRSEFSLQTTVTKRVLEN